MNTKPTTSHQQVIRFKNVPVITTEQLSQLYGTSTYNIKMNFSRNKSKFIEGKHFFKLTGQDLKDFVGNSKLLTNHLYPDQIGLQISSKARSLILWTERGAARHAKMLDTEHAWEVFERLEDCYFNQVVANKPAPVTLTDKLYTPKGVGRYFVENDSDGTITVRKADGFVLIRRSQLETLQKDSETIRQELELYKNRIDRMLQAVVVKEDALPLVGKIANRGIY